MDLKTTPLHAAHKELGGRMVPFAGYEMPVQYSSIIEEHAVVREKAGIFDVSHMGELFVQGPGCVDFLQYVTCNDVARLEPGKVMYNLVVNADGGVVDDIIMYMQGPEDYFIVANASNYEAVYAHFLKYASGFGDGVVVRNESNDWHQIALQGPLATQILKDATGLQGDDLQYFTFRDVEWQGATLRLSRTGYTGEDGFEIYSSNDVGVKLWKTLLDAGAPSGLKPCGLGARDTLRLEARLPLYGHELTAERTPVESGLGWAVKEKQRPFLGSERILRDRREGPAKRVVGFKMKGAGIPREGYAAFDAEGQTELGPVLSGTHSPTLKQGIGTAFLPAEYNEPGRAFCISVRGRMIEAEAHKGPFVKGGAGGK